MTITFSNPGEIDIRGATIAGLSAKESTSPIGLFGTGLKYSIACILRWKGEVTIHSGLTEYHFHATDIEFRNQQFKQIWMQAGDTEPTPLGFTTEYGKQWEPWMVYRELYANARDEGGEVTTSTVTPKPNQTTIVVTCGLLQAEHQHRDTIILPIEACAVPGSMDEPGCATISAGESKHIYYRGVRVLNTPAAATYNVYSKCDLTEDRTLRSMWTYSDHLGRATAQLTDADLIRAILHAQQTRGTFEYMHLTWSPYYQFSPAFIDVIAALYDLDAQKWSHFRDILAKHRPEITRHKLLPLPPIRQKMLDRAITLAARMGVAPDKCPIHYADLGPTILGLYSRELDEIFLSPAVFEQGTKQVLSTLFEELVHRETAKADLTYDLQTYLFNRVISLYEEHVFQEPI